MHADSMQLIKTWLLVSCNCKMHPWWSGAIVLTCPLVGYDHRDITAGLRQVWHIYLRVQPHNYRCACKSAATDSNISAGRCNSNRHVYWSSLIVTDVPGGQVQLQETCLLVQRNV